ncbi:MAG: hypothetical protein LBB48_03760 [Treponema sp.]|jgi:hypothetical protein|nr:hypothetical protein [Treponema sp.]
MKKKFVSIVFSLVAAMSIWAGGKTEKQSISDPAGFKETIDINGKKPGKYNFYVEADDKGANVQIAGPGNIFIDPESDLPVVMITNPGEDMRVPGNLNVVGTCVDDDAVDYVELMFNNDPATVVRAEGKEFWSYSLETKDMKDGLYTITATGVDINGLRGRARKVSWNLDRRQPVITVDNIAPGGLIHGKVTLKGGVWDGNGAASLSFSAIDDAPFANVPIKTDKKTKTAAYSAVMDTKAFADGPLKIRFKAVDKQGTEGIYTHLVFVDNTPPVVEVVYPDKTVNGIFTAAGYVQDVIGLESLSWKIGKGASDLEGAISGTFELTPGNIWWTKEFKILDNKAKFVELEITAKDLSGNIVSKKQRIAVNANDDLPVVSLAAPTANQVIDGTGFVIRGTVADDDGVDSIFYAIDGNVPVEIQTTGIKTTSGEFHIAAANLAPGSHTLEVWAKDISGVEGIKQRVTGIVIAGEKPSIRIAQVQNGGAKNAVTKPFYSGFEVQSETETYVIVEVSGGSPIQSVAYRFGGLAPGQAKLIPPKSAGNPAIAEIPLPADVDFGLVPLLITATDIAQSADKNAAKNGVPPVQRETTLLDYVIVTDLSAAHLPSIKDAPRFVINDAYVQKEAPVPSAQAVETPAEGQAADGEPGAALPTVQPVASATPATINRFTFVGDYPLAGYFVGSDVKDIALEPATEAAVLERDGNRFTIRRGSAKESAAVKIVVTTTHDIRYESEEYVLNNSYNNELDRLDARIELINTPEVKNILWASGTPVIMNAPQKTAVKGYQIQGNALEPDPKKNPVSSVEFSFTAAEGGYAKTVKGVLQRSENGERCVIADLPADLPPTRISLIMTAAYKDKTQAQDSGDIVIIRPLGTRSVNHEENFRWLSPKTLSNGATMLLDGETPLLGLYSGKPVREAAINGTISGLGVSVDENGLVVLKADKDGVYNAVTFTITDTEGWTYKTDAYSFIADSSAPIIALLDEPGGAWVQNDIHIRFEVDDSNGIQETSYSLNLSGEWLPLDSTDTALDLSNEPDGLVTVSVKTKDNAEKSSEASFVLYKDTAAPSARLIVPCMIGGEPAKVNGKILIGIEVTEKGRLASAVYEKPGAADADAEDAATDAVNAGGFTTPIDRPSYFISMFIGVEEYPLLDNMKFHFTDASGNTGALDSWTEFEINQITDIPSLEINLPEENEIIIADFAVSGVVYDDDAVAKIWYSIDDGPETEMEVKNAYSIPLELLQFTDNEHHITISAEDVYGIRGEPIERTFKISLEEPKAAMVNPAFDVVNAGILAIQGTASDKNDIALVQVSFDNGLSYDNANGTTEWTYRFDTNILKDGTHVVFIKVWDKYNISGLYSSLINIDNTPPTLMIERPMDGTSTVGQVSISGQATDGISLQNVVISIRSTEGVPIPEHLTGLVREPDSILIETLDISALPDGLYSLDIQATDKAGNISRASRYIELAKDKNPNFIEVLYPMNGETVQGRFNLYGYVGGADKASSVSLEINGVTVDTVPVTNAGYFRFTLDENTRLVSDSNTLVVKSDFDGHGETVSYPRMIEYKRMGPWITIDTLTMGDYAYQRPYLRGVTGYALSEDDLAVLADKKALKAAKANVAAKVPAFVEISFDNGKTFKPVAMKKKGAWEYRIEDWDMEQGVYYLLIKAVMKNGETAVTKTLVQINKTPPVITLISPRAGGHYNQTIDFTGIVSDDVEVNSAHFVLRTGSKESYEVPGFMQGMYLDGHFLGGTLWDIGAGLSFFDDNVKLQFQYGQFTKEQYALFGENNPRFYGNVFGLKLLAGVYALNFGSFGGPDWSWLSLSAAVGANFSYFIETQSGSPTILPTLILQLEFPKISIPKMKMFRNVSLYVEPQFWFVSTDAEVETTGVETIMFRITGGLRIYVF